MINIRLFFIMLTIYLSFMAIVALVIIPKAESETYQDRYFIPLVMCENDGRKELQHEYNKIKRYDLSAARAMRAAVNDSPRCPDIRR